MKRKLQKWTQDTAEELREISRDIAWAAEKIYKSAKGSLSIPEPPAEPQKAVFRQMEVPDPEEEQRALTRELERAVHGAYYRQGGVRFYGICLERYVRVELETETNLPKMWAAGYNTCIDPMLRQIEQLEKEMAAICSEYQQRPLPLSNAALLQTMRQFYTGALENNLHLQTGWDPEAYRRTLGQYGMDLREQLLIPFCRLDES